MQVLLPALTLQLILGWGVPLPVPADPGVVLAPATHRARPEAGQASVARQGNDPTAASRLRVSILAGANWPVGDMNVVQDPGFLMIGRGEYQTTRRLRVGVELGFHSFDAERPGTRDNEGILDLGVFGKVLGGWGPYRPYGLVGFGAYISKEADGSRRWDPGFQVGAGVELPLSPYLAATAGGGSHFLFRGGGNEDYLWLDGYLGFVFKLP